MAGLVPAIHALLNFKSCKKDVDARHKAGHDAGRESRIMARALVTGTSAGLGRAIAVALAREGYDLALTELSIDALKDTLADPAVANRKAVPITLDLRSQDSIKSAFEKATKEL